MSSHGGSTSEKPAPGSGVRQLAHRAHALDLVGRVAVIARERSSMAASGSAVQAPGASS
jgi:hypothetical protein